MEAILYTVVGQLTFVGILFRWLQVQIRDNRIKIELVYTKQETNDMIDLKQKPIEVGIDHVKEQLAEVKAMIGKLLDEKNKG